MPDDISVFELADLFSAITNDRAAAYNAALSAWNARRRELTEAQQAYNAARGYELIDAIEVLNEAQKKMLAAAAELEQHDPPRDE